MALLDVRKRQAIQEVVDRWRERCLLEDGSLLFDFGASAFATSCDRLRPLGSIKAPYLLPALATPTAKDLEAELLAGLTAAFVPAGSDQGRSGFECRGVLSPRQPASPDTCRGMTDRTTALLVDRRTKVYADGTHALDALELRLPAGSFFVLGPNGAGNDANRFGRRAGARARGPDVRL